MSLKKQNINLKFFGHAFFKISFGKTNFLVDPLINNFNSSEIHKPLISAAVKEDKLTGIDAIFISNESFDHFDKTAVEKIASKNSCVVVAHQSILSELNLPPNNLKPIQSGKKFSLNGVDITVTSIHRPRCFYPVGYLFKKDDLSVFHAGGTRLIEKFTEEKPSIALLPIGGGNTMDLIDAVRATKSMKPDIVVPMIYNSFTSNKADANDFAARINKSNVKTNPIILKPKQTYKFELKN
jgi:L-ascorbate metabolism protein UlaG (beta-lactamase superfamily)